MNETFNSWQNINNYSLDEISNLIITGRNAKQAVADKWLLKYLGDPIYGLKLMDFGCGIGRNTFYIGITCPHWKIIGYDNHNMLSKTKEYYSIHYQQIYPSNIIFETNWDVLKKQKFDTIFCCLVLQHIYKNTLEKYIADFKTMTSKLVVTGRRINDGSENESTWKILENNGLIPTTFLYGDKVIDYNPEGNAEEHNTAIYNL